MSKFTKDDINNFKVFRAIIQKGNFELNGGAVLRVASLFQWFDTLGSKIEFATKEQSKKGAPKIKEVK